MQKKKKSKYDSPFQIVSLKPIQMPNLDLQELRDSRADFTSEECRKLAEYLYNVADKKQAEEAMEQPATDEVE